MPLLFFLKANVNFHILCKGKQVQGLLFLLSFPISSAKTPTPFRGFLRGIGPHDTVEFIAVSLFRAPYCRTIGMLQETQKFKTVFTFASDAVAGEKEIALWGIIYLLGSGGIMVCVHTVNGGIYLHTHMYHAYICVHIYTLHNYI